MPARDSSHIVDGREVGCQRANMRSIVMLEERRAKRAWLGAEACLQRWCRSSVGSTPGKTKKPRLPAVAHRHLWAKLRKRGASPDPVPALLRSGPYQCPATDSSCKYPACDCLAD